MDYTTLNDKKLWERCKEGDERAYGELMDRHAHKMLRVAIRYVKDTMKAEEIVMDGFINLWNKREQIVDGNFLNYLFRCIRNSIISFYRKEVQIAVGLEQVELACMADYAPDSPLISEDIGNIYNTALEKLTPRRREAFILSREENLSYFEIARKMNLSVGVVKNYMNAALEDMRANMKGCLPLLIILSLPF